jgi:hypothetical protein
MTTCPHCGGALRIVIARANPSMIETVPDLLVALGKTGPKGQPVSTYPAQNGGHFLTCIGGQVKESVLREAIRRDLVRPEYPDRADLDAWRLKP